MFNSVLVRVVWTQRTPHGTHVDPAAEGSPYLRSNCKLRVLKCLGPPACLPGASSSWGLWRRRDVGPPERSAASSFVLWISCSGTKPRTEAVRKFYSGLHVNVLTLETMIFMLSPMRTQVQAPGASGSVSSVKQSRPTWGALCGDPIRQAAASIKQH